MEKIDMLTCRGEAGGAHFWYVLVRTYQSVALSLGVSMFDLVLYTYHTHIKLATMAQGSDIIHSGLHIQRKSIESTCRQGARAVTLPHVKHRVKHRVK